MDVLVIGCGVSGLSCAIRLCEAGHAARIWARATPPDTTSNIAAAIWYPYKAYPEDLVGRWAASAYSDFVQLAQLPDTGVCVRGGIEIFPMPTPDPWWRDALPGFRRATPNQLPPGYQDGYVFEAPVIEMPIYLEYLMRRFESLGGRIELRDIASLDQALAECAIVVNCAGLGARELVGDAALYAIQGQVVRVAQIGLEQFILDEHGPRGLTYIVPRSHDCVLGGTSEDRREGLEPDPAIAAAIIERCAALVPQLRDAEILSHKVGLRPGRPAVRLEAERPAPGRLVVHNYGHGGAGVTLSWGCAADVVRLVEQFAQAG